jgi:hypothetical protein
MSLARLIGIGFLILLVLGLALFIASFVNYYNHDTGTSEAIGTPAGIAYTGPRTTALAGYYCIASMNSVNGYSIQLNAWLSNGLFVQNVYGNPVVEESFNGGPWVTYTGFIDNVWVKNANGTPVLIHANNPIIANANCAWLVIAVKGGYVYFGYSLDGRSITWYDSYPAGASYIVPSGFTGELTGMVIGGPGYGSQAQLGSGTLVYLALYYYNGTSWVPARISLSTWQSPIIETVNHAWVFTGGKCGGVVSWPNPANVTQCPPPPNFKP